MYFGSVRFFRHLILVVLGIFIIVPTVLSIVFFCENREKDEEIRRLASQVEQLQNGINTDKSGDKNSSAENSGANSEIKAPVSSVDIGYSSDTASSDDLSASSDGSEDIYQPENSDNSVDISIVTSLDSEAESDIPDSMPEDISSEESEPEDISSEESEPDENQDLPYYAQLYPDMYVDSYEGKYINDSKTVYLTFDDGPSILTENILMYLEQEGVQATFFVVTEDIEYSKEQIKTIYAAGHTIGVHSYSHDYEKIYSSVESFLDDFYVAFNAVYEATGVKPDIFRFPGGSVNDFNEETRDDIIAEMTRRGFTYFDWNVDSHDWEGYSWSQMYNNVVSEAEKLDNPIILFHDTSARENTVLVIEDVIKALKEKGYKFGCLSQKTKPLHL